MISKGDKPTTSLEEGSMILHDFLEEMKEDRLLEEEPTNT